MGQTAKAWRHALASEEGLVAAGFRVVKNAAFELLHPRGGDGRFLNKNGHVRWRDDAGLWKRGTVTDISSTGTVTVTDTAGAQSIRKPASLFGTPAPRATLSATKFKRVGGQGGSNPGFLGEDANGDKWYVKTPKSPAHVNNELVAQRLYELAGAAVPDARISPDGKQYMSKIEDSVAWGDLDPADQKSAIAEIRKNFVVDAWLANWDAPANDNIRVTKDGVALRVDTGGALDYRARGGPKTLAPDVPELQTLRDPNISWSGSRLYAGLTKDEEEDGVRRILAISPDSIRDSVSDAGAPSRLADDLIARRAFLATHYGFVLPETTTLGQSILSGAKADGAAVSPGLAKAVRKSTSGDPAPLVPGSPVWLQNKPKDGKRYADTWTIESVSADKTSVTLASLKGNTRLTVPLSDVEILRANFASSKSQYNSGEKPEVGDRVKARAGDGEVTNLYPMYAQVKLDSGATKVIEVKKLDRLDDPAPADGKSGLYTIPFDDNNFQATHLKQAEAEIRGGRHTDKVFNTADLIPTQDENKTSTTGSGSGTSDLGPIVARIGGKDYLLDGHHRASGSDTVKAHFVDFDAIAANPNAGPLAKPKSDPKGKQFDVKAHDFKAEPHPEVFSLTHGRSMPIFKQYDNGDLGLVNSDGMIARISPDNARIADTVDADAIKADIAAAKALALAGKSPAKLTPIEKRQAKIDAMTLADAQALPGLPIKQLKYPAPRIMGSGYDVLQPGDKLYDVRQSGGGGGLYLIRDGKVVFLGGAVKNQASSYGSTGNMLRAFLELNRQKAKFNDLTPPEYQRAGQLIHGNDALDLQKAANDVKLTYTPKNSSVRETVDLTEFNPDTTNNVTWDPEPGYSGQSPAFITDHSREVAYYIGEDNNVLPRDKWIQLTKDQYHHYFNDSNILDNQIFPHDVSKGATGRKTAPLIVDGEEILQYRSQVTKPDGSMQRKFNGTVSGIYYEMQDWRQTHGLVRLPGAQALMTFNPRIPEPKSKKDLKPEDHDWDELPEGAILGLTYHNNHVVSKNSPATILNSTIPTSRTSLLDGDYDEEFLKYVTSYNTSTEAKSVDGTDQGDPLMHDFARHLGLESRVVRLDDKDFDAYLAGNKGKLNTPVYRGVPTAQMRNDFQAGTDYSGLGVYGNGIYTATNYYTAVSYAEGEEKNVTAIAIRPTAVIEEYPEVKIRQLSDLKKIADQQVDQMHALGIGPDRKELEMPATGSVIGTASTANKITSAASAARGRISKSTLSPSDKTEGDQAVMKVEHQLHRYNDHFESLGAKLTTVEYSVSMYGRTNITANATYTLPDGSNMYTEITSVVLERKATRRLGGTPDPGAQILQSFRRSDYSYNRVGSSTTAGHHLNKGFTQPSDITSIASSLNPKLGALTLPEREKALESLRKTTARYVFVGDTGRYALASGIDAVATDQGGGEYYYAFTNRASLIMKKA